MAEGCFWEVEGAGALRAAGLLPTGRPAWPSGKGPGARVQAAACMVQWGFFLDKGMPVWDVFCVLFPTAPQGGGDPGGGWERQEIKPSFPQIC